VPPTEVIVARPQQFRLTVQQFKRITDAHLRSPERVVLSRAFLVDTHQTVPMAGGLLLVHNLGSVAFIAADDDATDDVSLDDAFAEWADESLILANESFEAAAAAWPRD